MHLFFLFSTFLFGLLIGSFLNVCIYRLPKGQSIVLPRSYCPRCGRRIYWYDNIPLLSFIFLAGRCRACRKPISMRYPLVELLTALLSASLFLKFGLSLPYFLYFFGLTCPLIVITFIDLEHRIIPDSISLPGIAVGFVTTLLVSGFSPIEALIYSGTGMIAGGGSLLLISWIYEKIRHQEGIGGGDIKLAAMLGAFFGWKEIFLILLLSSLLGSLVGLSLIVFKRKGMKEIIPFGPFLALAALINLFFGRDLITAYLNLTYQLYLIMYN